MARFFVKASSISGRKAAVRGSEYHHMKNVLRLRPGDSVVLFDGRGNEHEGVVAEMGSTQAKIELTRSYKPARESPLAITLAQALPKGARMDFVVEKATELGVAAIIPFTSSYTAARDPQEVGATKAARWRRIATAAAKQCGRAVVPAIHRPVAWPQVVAAAGKFGLRLIFDPAAPTRLGRSELPAPTESTSLLVAVGPEGGFSAVELGQAREAGFQQIGLGPRILRTETAGIAAIAVCQLWWGDLGGPA